ncbi:MAG: nitrite/sulfite reductase [Anaerolineaceae bacterium]|nr:nitrite/sulfite reductase [Anaerolineaceae bacterium]
MSQISTWKERLQTQMADDLAHEIDIFEGQMELRKQGKLDEKVFAETRLRRGVYGQRYDNGQRHDGAQTQTLAYPSSDIVKGPDTLWDAPGMMRIKIPFGGLTAVQLDVMAQLAEEYADDILHVTTRQDIQLHFVHIEDTPDLMRRLAAVGITTLEACGNSVRNVTACPLAGVCHTETFDVTPYSKALAYYLLGHDDVQDFGRKVKIAFSGCEHEACALVKMHDVGFLARVKEHDGELKRGFDIYVGGGLGTVPHQARLLAEFVSEEEIFPVSQAVARVFARHGEKRNRNRARLKFLVAQVGIEEFRRLVAEERETLPYDPRWTAYLDDLPNYSETPARPPIRLEDFSASEEYKNWQRTNVYWQRQPGYATVTVNLPLGDLSSEQAFQLADIAREYVGDNLRTTVEQNIVLRWVAEADLPALYEALTAVNLGAPGAGTIVDITSCPGTDTCKLGIASSRGLAGELRTRLAAQNATLPQAVKDLRIKISGCFNSCGQHHVADIGFFGNSRRRNNRTVPHFQVVLGGKWQENAGSYGLAVGAVPSKKVPEVLDAITSRYVVERERSENFQEWIGRLGKKEVRDMLTPFTEIPLYEADKTFYSDWGDPREFGIGDMGVGECAGEVITLFSFEIAKAEGILFDALLALDDADYALADERAYQAMILAARALVRNQFLDVGDNPADIVNEFRQRFYDTQLFYDRYAKGKFARYLFARHENPNPGLDLDSVRQLVEEANLFIEACHACDARLAGALAGGVSL